MGSIGRGISASSPLDRDTQKKMATDQYYMHMAKMQEKEGIVGEWTQKVPQRNVRHYRMSKQSKVRHTMVMREKVVEVPERLKVDDSNDPLAGDDAEAIISRRMAEGVNNRRTMTGGFFTS